MELYPGGSFVPVLDCNSCQNETGSENLNPEGVFESNMDIQPEMYDFSCFLEGDLADDVFPEYKEMFKATCLPRTVPVVPEIVQIPPPPPPPQDPKPCINSSTRPSGNLRWTKELHACFVDAVRRLGGAFIATPKTVRDIMNVEGLSLDQVKNHLQNYRMGKRLCNDWRKLYKHGSSFCRALGAPSNLVSSSQPLLAKKRGPKPKPTKLENGLLQMEILFQKHLLRRLEAQTQNAKFAAGRMAANQTMGRHASAANQNTGRYPFVPYQNIGGHAFPQNQKMGGHALSGAITYPENSFMREAPTTLTQSRHSYQMNQYNGCTSAAAIHAGIPAAYPHQQAQASFPVNAASGLYQPGFNFTAGESSGTTGMSDEEFIESILIDYDELTGGSG